MISEQTIELLKQFYGPGILTLTMQQVHIGLFLTAVRLSDGSCGVATSLNDAGAHCCKEERDFGDLSPSKFTGSRVMDLFETPKKNHLVDSLRIAVMNALSSQILSRSDYTIMENVDPVDLLDLDSPGTITIVGSFQSYIRKICRTKNKLYVLELNESAIADEHKQYFVPANDFNRVLPESDIIIITGLTLVNNTIEGLLSAAPPRARVIVTGPSSSIIPDILFKSGVNMIGATRITDPELLFRVVSEGGGGYHLFQYCAQKICIINESKPSK